jgi:hypothetical protein
MGFDELLNRVVLLIVNDLASDFHLMNSSFAVEQNPSLQKDGILGGRELLTRLGIKRRIEHPLGKRVIRLDVKSQVIDLAPWVVDALGDAEVQE